jgi:hypothetical protein
MKTGDSLTSTFSGLFTIRGTSSPYNLNGKCRVLQANLTKLEGTDLKSSDDKPIFNLDINCEARDHIFVKADVMDAEFRGSFRVQGTNSQIGLVGNAEAIRGSVIFRDTKFNLIAGTVRFESPTSIAPRFNISGRSQVKEQKTTNPQEYELTLNVFGTPQDYKIRLTSSPALAEADIISLLLLGVTSRSQEGNYFDLGTTIVGQIPLQSKIQGELGVDIKINTQASKSGGGTTASPVVGSVPITSGSTDATVPSVRIQKEITKKTKLSYSNTLEAIPSRELKLEHMLDENLSINGTAVDALRDSTQTQTTRSYGLDIRYRFSFE